MMILLFFCLTKYQLDFYISLQQRPTGKRYRREKQEKEREDAKELLVYLFFTHHDLLCHRLHSKDKDIEPISSSLVL